MFVADHASQLVMGFTPKSGCTTSLAMFFERVGLLTSKSMAQEEAKNPSKVHIVHSKYMPLWRAKKIKRTPNMRGFKVVRNPYARAVSSFFYAMGYSEPLCKLVTMETGRSDPSFLEFVSAIGSMMDAHFAPQWNNEEDPFEHIVHLETFAEDIEALNRAIGERLDPNVLRGAKHYAKRDEASEDGKWDDVDIAALPWSVLSVAVKQKGMPQHCHFFKRHPECAESIRSVFARDFAEYGYSDDIAGLSLCQGCVLETECDA